MQHQALVGLSKFEQQKDEAAWHPWFGLIIAVGSRPTVLKIVLDVPDTMPILGTRSYVQNRSNQKNDKIIMTTPSSSSSSVEHHPKKTNSILDFLLFDFC